MLLEMVVMVRQGCLTEQGHRHGGEAAIEEGRPWVSAGMML